MDSQEQCEVHPTGHHAGNCIHCGKAVCNQCVTERGYFCSDACKAQYAAAHPQDPEQKQAAAERADLEASSEVLTTWLFRRIPLGILALVAVIFGLRYLDRSGKQIWEVKSPGDVGGFVDLVVDDDSVYGIYSKGCVAYDLKKGTQKWKTKLAVKEPTPSSKWSAYAPYMSSFGLFTEDLVTGAAVVGDGLLLYRDSMAVRAFDTANGAELWNRKLGSYMRTDPALDAEHVLLTEPIQISRAVSRTKTIKGRGPRAVCLDAGTGKESWERIYPDSARLHAVGVSGDTCFCVSSKGYSGPYELNVMRTSDGKPLWTSWVTNGVITEAHIYENRVVMFTETHVYVLGLEGSTLGKFKFPSEVRTLQAIDDHVILGTDDNRVIVLNSHDASVLWEHSLHGWAWQIETGGGQLYLTTGVPVKKDEDDSEKAPDGSPEERRALTAEEQMMQEAAGEFGDPDGGPLSMWMPTDVALISYDLQNGKEKWRTTDFAGSIVAHDAGCMTILQGRDSAIYFLHGTGWVLNSRTRGKGKQCWQYKALEDLYAARITDKCIVVYAVTKPKMRGTWGKDTEPGPKIRVIRRRTFVNRLRKM